jgi:hypothetical protein
MKMATKRKAVANLRAARVIMDALGIIKSEPQDLSILITRAIQADAIAHTDAYNNQCQYIKDLIAKG